MSAKEDGSVIKDTNVVLEIPAPTTIAYGVIELYVKLDGQFGECHLLPWVLGERDGKCGAPARHRVYAVRMPSNRLWIGPGAMVSVRQVVDVAEH